MWQYQQTEMLCKRKRKEVKIQEFVYRDTANVEPEMYDCTSNNWSHWNSNEKFKEKFGNCARKTFDRFTTKDGYTWNITHNTESTAMWSLKPEWWGSQLVQEKYQTEKACDKRQPYRIIIIIIWKFTWRLTGECRNIVKIFGYLIYIGFEILEQESSTLPEPDSRQMPRNF